MWDVAELVPSSRLWIPSRGSIYENSFWFLPPPAVLFGVASSPGLANISAPVFSKTRIDQRAGFLPGENQKPVDYDEV